MVLRAFSGLTTMALLASRLACLVVLAWFVLFAIDQSGDASHHQTQEVAGTAEPVQVAKRPSSARRTLDKAAKTLTEPFDRTVASSSSPWVTHVVKTVLALLLYGLVVGFVVRMIRVRV